MQNCASGTKPLGSTCRHTIPRRGVVGRAEAEKDGMCVECAGTASAPFFCCVLERDPCLGEPTCFSAVALGPGGSALGQL